MAVELNFHAKLGCETLQGGAGRPPLGRPAKGCGRLGTAFAWTSQIASWSRCSLRSWNAAKARPAGPGEARRPSSGSHRPSVAPMLQVDACDLSGRWIADLDMALRWIVGPLILVQAFRSIRSNRRPILDSNALELVTLLLDQRRGSACGSCPISSIFVMCSPEIRTQPKFVELIRIK